MSTISFAPVPIVLRVIRGGPDPDTQSVGQPDGERPPAMRLRPGERPLWVALDLSVRDVVRIRATAGNAGIGPDALMALAIEWMLVTEDLEGAERRLRARADEPDDFVRLAPTPALRTWVQLLGHRQEPVIDALPELLLPERLLARWRPEAASALRALDELPVAAALAAERAAASAGLTLTEWSYRSALMRV